MNVPLDDLTSVVARLMNLPLRSTPSTALPAAAVLLGNAQPDQTPAELSKTLQEARHSRDSIHTE
ncbi:hypothetical protein [Arthrobacter zhaoguopingii]|uniref:hypothetical protein n=1 Tax=Arthrobacter zhaoguopingii TaxID=2681491 RepID=UPI0013569AA6|nr:hypothetical protein [Arthrobacter zhaoguopingii]